MDIKSICHACKLKKTKKVSKFTKISFQSTKTLLKVHKPHCLISTNTLNPARTWTLRHSKMFQR